MDASVLVYGLLAGSGWLLAHVGKMAARGPYWMYDWFRPRSENGDKRSIRRLKKALKYRSYEQGWEMMGGFPSLFIVATLLALIGQEDAYYTFSAGMLVGYTSLSFLGHRLGLLRNYNLRVYRYGSIEVARRLHPSVAHACLLPLAAHRDPNVRLAVVPALRALGTPEAIEALRNLRFAEQPELAKAATVAVEDLLALPTSRPMSVQATEMATLASTHKRLFAKMSKEKATRKHKFEFEEFTALERRMDELVFSQLHLRQSFPHLYCLDCFARAEILAYEGWSWVRCRQCQEGSSLLPNAQIAIGVIGAQAPWELKDGELRLSIWDDQNRKARAAELEVLEVVGGQEIHYDWAVSAVVTQLERTSNFEQGKIRIQLVNAPPLEPNSLHLLRHMQPVLEEVARDVETTQRGETRDATSAQAEAVEGN